MIDSRSLWDRRNAALAVWVSLAARFRWAFLPVSVAGAILLDSVGSPYRFTVAQSVVAVLLFAVLVLPLLIDSSRPRPALLITGPRGVATPHNLGHLAFAVTVTLLVGIDASTIIVWTWLGVNTASLSILALFWFRALRWSGIRLEADGVRYRQIRTYFIPWQRAPELLTGGQIPPHRWATGRLHPGNRKIAPTTDPAYLAAAIHQYVTHPEHRAALGSATELTRLTALLSSIPQNASHQPSP